MASSLVIMTHWTLNQDKTFTFYENKKNPSFSTGQMKEFKYSDSDKVSKMFEHKIPLSGKLIEATGFVGYQYKYLAPKTKLYYTIIVAFGRRIKEGKKFVQDLDDILILMGLKEPIVVVDVSANAVDVSANAVDVSANAANAVDVSANAANAVDVAANVVDVNSGN